MIKINGQVYQYSFYPDGTLLMRFLVEQDTDDIQYRLTWNYENLTEQLELHQHTSYNRRFLQSNG